MVNVLFAADFPIAKTGIASTASSILAEDVLGPTTLYSVLPLTINGAPVHPIRELKNAYVDLIFTHTEYSGLPALQRRFPEALFHVGDWPLRHWNSIRKIQPIKAALAILRCHWRLLKVERRARLAFVTQEDCSDAIAHGFHRAMHLPIGVKPSKEALTERVDVQSVCFSGNFRYQPNRDAAHRLIRLAQAQFPKLRIVLVGFYADDFKDHVGNMVEIHPNVPSVVDFLAARRPIYVSLIETGAGAKNKILEAIVAGCPIVCTAESLDFSIPAAPSIKIVKSDDEVAPLLLAWSLSASQPSLTLKSDRLADDIRASRSWNSVARMTRDMITRL
jgi:glycosyltransferase involved in cell wall biosynthesis